MTQMAAVLASLFQGGWQSTDRAQREVKEVEKKIMQPRVVVPLHTEAQTKRAVEPTSGGETDDQEHQSQTDDEDIEGASEEEDTDSPNGSEEAPRRDLKRKRKNQRAFQRNTRIKATPSEEDATEEGSENSSEADEDWEADNENGGDEGQENADVSTCLCVLQNTKPRWHLENANRDCSFCNRDENDDPGEDFEELLTCTNCGEKGKPVAIKASSKGTGFADVLVFLQPTVSALERLTPFYLRKVMHDPPLT